MLIYCKQFEVLRIIRSCKNANRYCVCVWSTSVSNFKSLLDCCVSGREREGVSDIDIIGRYISHVRMGEAMRGRNPFPRERYTSNIMGSRKGKRNTCVQAR